jgi:hypothetical protein
METSTEKDAHPSCVHALSAPEVQGMSLSREFATENNLQQCDGERPVCSACIQMGQGECTYEVKAGQTRAAAAKIQIQHLKDIVSSLCSASDRDAAIAIASLLQDGLSNLEKIALAMRTLTSAPDTVAKDPVEENGTSTTALDVVSGGSNLQAFLIDGNADLKHLTVVSPRAEQDQSLTVRSASDRPVARQAMNGEQ